MIIRHALRSLQRAPAFTIAAILTLVLGIASLGTMFAIVYGVLLAPLPYGAPERLVSVGLQGADLGQIGQATGMYSTYARYAQHLDGIALYRTGSTNLRMSDGDGAAESVIATWVSASMIPLLQIPPVLGRTFSAEEELRGGPDAVILSEFEWRNRFDSARDVIGKTLIVNDVPRVIVGVMPAQFAFPTVATRVWLPVKHSDDGALGDFSNAGIARLAPGATPALAQAELAALLPRVAELFPHLQTGGQTATWLAEARAVPTVVALRDELTGEIAGTLWMLAAAAGLVLLVAWANVANLMLVRSESRQQELSVRRSLGAGRLSIASQFFGESFLLGAAALVFALLLTHGAVSALVVYGPADIPRLAELEVGLMATGFITLVTILGAIICATVPMLHIRRTSLARTLHDGARGQSAGRSRQRVRSSITVIQIAIALVVTVGSAMLLRTAQHLHAVRPGFDATEVLTLRILLPFARYGDAANVGFYGRLTELIAQVPSVHAVGLTRKLPLGSGWTAQELFQLQGVGKALPMPVNLVSNGYFAAMRVPLLAGRDFSPVEVEQARNIIISQHTAASIFGDADGAATVGKTLTLAPDGPSYTIVGVVANVRYEDLTTPPTNMIYRPHAVPIDPAVDPKPSASLVMVVRSSEPIAAVAAIRGIMRDLDPTVPIFDLKPMQDVVRASMAQRSIIVMLLTAAAAITLVIGGIGLYGVMAYIVALRTREFGVRAALGADMNRIARLVIARGLAVTACGIVLGYALYAIVAPFLRAFVYGVTLSDPVTLAAATLVVFATATLASWLPARRAARVDPLEALRAD